MTLKSIDGLPILNAKKSIKLTVNKNDINKADIKEPDDCAVARACRRELHALEVRVHLARVYVKTNKGNWTRYLTPKNMRNEIIAFDRGGTFEPNTFELTPPHKSKTTGKRQGSAKRKKNLSIKNRRKPPNIITNVRMGPA